MTDSILDDFLARFGDPEKKEKLNSLNKLETKGLNISNSALKTEDISSQLNNKIASLSEEGDVSGLDKAANIGGKAIGAIAPAISLIDNFKGGQFNTSPDRAKPGNPKGEIIQGAMAGGEFGKALGGGPITQAAGMAVGGLISTFAHTKAKKEWVKNKKEANLNEDYLSKMKRKNEYAQSEGLESLENLKALRKKQLGL